jgi:hypothetical protein
MAKKKTPPKVSSPSFAVRLRRVVQKPFVTIRQRVDTFLNRRPHRSFRRTLRRDYVRSLKLPGYWSFTNTVRKTLWQHKKTFLWLFVIYIILTFILVGITSQDSYSQISDTLRTTGGDLFKGKWGEVGQAGILLLIGATGGSTSTLTDTQQVYAGILILFTWLTTVWLLRAILGGKKPKLRDGLYSSGAPALSTLLVVALGVVQLLPVAIAFLGFSGVMSAGLAVNGVESMVFWVVVLLLVALSLYWLTSTFFALVVVTLPGMYPMQAIRAAGDLVIGRRFRILLRLLWLAFTVVTTWAIIMIPIIIFDAWFKGTSLSVQWIPIVPIALLLMTTVTIIWVASYVYILYRRIVDDDAAPA